MHFTYKGIIRTRNSRQTDGREEGGSGRWNKRLYSDSNSGSRLTPWPSECSRQRQRCFGFFVRVTGGDAPSGRWPHATPRIAWQAGSEWGWKLRPSPRVGGSKQRFIALRACRRHGYDLAKRETNVAGSRFCFRRFRHFRGSKSKSQVSFGAKRCLAYHPGHLFASWIAWVDLDVRRQNGMLDHHAKIIPNG
jgi:hypothetical protein